MALLDEPLDGARRHVLCRREERPAERRRVPRLERPEPHVLARGRARPPRRARALEGRTRQRDGEERRPRLRPDGVIERVERDLVGEVRVVEQHDQRPPGGPPSQRFTRGLRRRRPQRARRGADPADARVVGIRPPEPERHAGPQVPEVAAEPLVEQARSGVGGPLGGQIEGPEEQLAQRPIRASVRRRARDEAHDLRLGQLAPQPIHERDREVGLAVARFGDDAGRDRGPRDRAPRRRDEAVEHVVPPDERGGVEGRMSRRPALRRVEPRELRAGRNLDPAVLDQALGQRPLGEHAAGIGGGREPVRAREERALVAARPVRPPLHRDGRQLDARARTQAARDEPTRGGHRAPRRVVARVVIEHGDKPRRSGVRELAAARGEHLLYLRHLRLRGEEHQRDGASLAARTGRLPLARRLRPPPRMRPRRRRRVQGELERPGELRDALEPVVALLGEAPQHHSVELRRQHHDVARPRRTSLPMAHEDLGRHTPEGRPADQHLVQDHAHRVDVGPRVDLDPRVALLRRHVRGRAEDRPLGRDPGVRRVEAPHDAEVGETGPGAEVDEDVLGLEVAVGEARGVRRVEGAQDGGRERPHLVQVERARVGPEPRRERRGLDELHDEERRPVVEPLHAVEPGHPGRAYGGERFRFAHQACLGERLLAARQLDRHLGAAGRGDRREDHAEAAAPDQAQRAVPRANELRDVHGGRRGLGARCCAMRRARPGPAGCARMHAASVPYPAPERTGARGSRGVRLVVDTLRLRGHG